MPGRAGVNQEDRCRTAYKDRRVATTGCRRLHGAANAAHVADLAQPRSQAGEHLRYTATRMIEKPPPVLGNARVLEYAVLDESVTYLGHSSLFAGNFTDGLKELGPVPCLAIAQDLKTGEIILMHCDQDWDLLGLGGRYDSIADAKARVERTYHGVSSCWIDAKITQEEALKFRDEMWAGQRCSFCDKIPPDFNMMIERNNVRICNSCIAEFHKTLQEGRESEK